MHIIINPPISGFPGFREIFQGFQGFHERFIYFNEDFRISGKITRDFSEVNEISVSGGPLDYVATLTAHAHIQRKKCENDHVPSVSLVPRPHPQEEERVWYLTSAFLVVLSQHAYGNFVMQSDSRVTAVAHLFRLSMQRSLCIRLQRRSCFLFIARSRRSAWKDAYQQLTRRYGYRASEL